MERLRHSRFVTAAQGRLRSTDSGRPSRWETGLLYKSIRGPGRQTTRHCRLTDHRANARVACRQQGKQNHARMPGGADGSLRLHPGFDCKVVDVLPTNLHRPRSSHIVLTAAFVDKKFVMSSYGWIVEKGR